jgi:filamentous hemagglutinin family protein
MARVRGFRGSMSSRGTTARVAHGARAAVAACVALSLCGLPASQLPAQDVTTQIVRDGSIGPDRSVQPSAAPAASGGASYQIGESLGARSGDGATLFHSFQTFDVAAGDAAVFTTELPTRAVIARVTGGVRSNIFGSIGSRGPALPGTSPELFLLNPAGILFGPRARLGGEFSFVGSTADRLTFADGSTFGASLAAAPILTVGEVSELSFGSPGTIRADGGSIVGVPSVSLIAGSAGTRIEVRRDTDAVSGLRGLSGFSLLQSGDAAAGSGALQLSRVVAVADKQFRLFLVADGSIDIADSAFIPNPVFIFPLGFPTGGVVLVADATGAVRIRNTRVGDEPNFGEDGVEVRGATIDVTRSMFIGDRRLRLEASGLLRIAGNSELSSRRGGSIALRSGVRLQLDGSRIRSDPGTVIGLLADISNSLSGSISLEAPVVEIANRSMLSVSSSLNRAIGGEIRIVGDRIRVSASDLTSLASPMPLPRVGTAQRMLLDALGRSTEGSQAGSITLLGGDIEILERSSLNSSALTDRSPSAFPLDRFEDVVRGAAGEIRIDATRSVRIADSQLDTRVDALFSRPSGSVRIAGADLQIQRSAVTSEALSGIAGNVAVQSSGALTLRDASLTSSASGSGRAGSVSVDAVSITLSERSSIATQADQGPAPGQPADGSIAIQVSDTLLLEGQSSINASVVNGQGGDVRIAAPERFVMRDGSRLVATTEMGTGGRIDVTAGAFLVDSSSVVSADAGLGMRGSVKISSPDVDLQRGIEGLPAQFLNVSALLRPSCEAREVSGATATFYVARMPGLPPSPEEWLVAYEPSGRELDAASESVPALLASARAQQSVGAYAESLATLERALAQAESAGDGAGVAAVLGASGNAQQALGQSAAAELLLTRGERLAQNGDDAALASRLANDLGNHYAVSGATPRARESYRDAIARAERSGDALATVQALANAARLALEASNGSEARVLLERAEERVPRLRADGAKASALIHLGHSRARLAEFAGAELRPASLLRAHALLQEAASIGRALEDPRLRSYALGNLGLLYRSEHRTEEALALTREALRAAERASAPDALYRWHWQEGQLLWAQGKADPAVRAYRRAVEILESTQQESRAQYGARAFGTTLAPVYLDLADALLRAADAVEDAAGVEALLLEARSTVEKLKAAELRNYLRDDCATQLEARTASLDSLASGAAVVYPIALRDRIELLVRLPGGLTRYTVPVDGARVEASARQLRLLLQDRTSAAYRPVARQLYDWLVRPYVAELAARGVETLVFVPAGALRSVPMAALHDGERFLAERYALATAPGLSLVDPRPLDLARVRPLLGGVSEPVAEFPALGSVPRELAAIREIFGGELLLDGEFRTDSIAAAVRESRPTLVHFASHAVFTGDPSTSFVLTRDGRMTMGELAALLGRTRFREDPIELLVLSACDTALGDERAALGLAGVAVRSGARSALGSLWAISDDATYPLIASFYAKLHEPGTSRAAALRHAQRELIRSERFAHPFYWSSFVLISNWL